MRIEQELAGDLPDGDSALTIGVFDGVHLGHRHLIERLKREGSEAGLAALVVTFRNHPASVLRPDFEPRYLTTFEERVRLIKGLEPDFVLPVTFDLELSKVRFTEFVWLLRDRLHMRQMVVGPDFQMGHKREGNVEGLQALGREMGFSVIVVDQVADGGQAVRSTTIRKAVLDGDVVLAATMLGRKFTLTGPVVKGVGRGAGLGFPTANLDVSPGMAIPGDGIYATWAHVGRRFCMAATSIGTRPTFDDGDRTIEAFLLDFEEDLYDRELRLEFVDRLRDEIKYDSVEALKAQVDRDVEDTKAALRESPPDPA